MLLPNCYRCNFAIRIRVYTWKPILVCLKNKGLPPPTVHTVPAKRNTAAGALFSLCLGACVHFHDNALVSVLAPVFTGAAPTTRARCASATRQQEEGCCSDARCVRMRTVRTTCQKVFVCYESCCFNSRCVRARSMRYRTRCKFLGFAVLNYFLCVQR